MMPVSALESFIAGLPKAELHVHQVGSASPRIVAELAAATPDGSAGDPSALAEFFMFDDFAHFIRIYLSVVDLIKTAEDVRLITYEVAADMAGQHIRYAELTVTPVHLHRRRDSRPRRSWRPSRTPASRPSVTWASSCAGSSTFPPTSVLPAAELTTLGRSRP